GFRGRPAQVPPGGHRLHRRAASLRVLRRGAGPPLRRARRHAGPAPRARRERLTRLDPVSLKLPSMSLPKTHDLPLFPLQTVLFPDGLLSLKVFEARYLDLMGSCLREGKPFGVVALKQGGEVAGAGG